MGLLQNKKALIVGALNNHSIAYGIAKAMHREGAEIALTYQNEKLKSRVEKIASEVNSNLLFQCDLSSDEQIEKTFSDLKNHWDKFDILVHSAAFAPSEQLEGDYVDSVTREGFKIAHDISSYSFAALAKAAKPVLNEGASLLTLSHFYM